MASSLGDAYVNIVPKAPGISNKIEGILNNDGGGAEKAGLNLGGKLLGGLAKLGIGAAVVKTIKDAFDEGGKLQQSFGGLDTIYGDASAAAKDYAKQAASAGISMNDYAEQAVSFGAALKQAYGGDTAAAVEAANVAILDMADNAAKMGTPLENIQSAYQGFAKQNYTMLDNLKLGYGGTKQEMERLLAHAQEISGVEYNIDNLGDVYNAIHVVQEELGLTGVASEEAATTLSGSMGAVKASWENVMAALTTGEGLDEAMANFSASIGNFANNVLTMLTNLGPQLPGLILGLADVIIANAPDFIASGVELIVQLAVGLIQGIPELIGKVPEIFAKCKEAFAAVDWASLGKSIIQGIINGIVAMAGALWNKIKEVVGNALRAGQDAAQTGSPSRLFANELGRWIPPGIAMGIEENTAPLDRAMQGLIDGSLLEAQNDYRPAGAMPGNDADRIIAALQNLVVHSDVVLKGDARGLFKVIRNENNTRTKATNYNALAVGV